MAKRRSITALAAALLLQALSSSSGFTPAPTTVIGSSLRSAASRSFSAQKLHSQQNPNDNNNNDNSGIELNRRSFTTASAAAALSSLLVTSSNVPFLPVSPALAAYEESSKAKQRILITGSNSGIGLDAAQRLALKGHEVVLACVS